MNKITILGSGTWGVALANLLVNNKHQVTVWSKFKEEIDEINKTKTHKNLKGVAIDESIFFTNDLNCVVDADIIIFATPSIFIRDTAVLIKDLINKNQIFVTVAKGIEKDTLYFTSDIILDVLGDVNVVALSGPTHAEEVAIGLPTLIVAACENLKIAQSIQEVFSNGFFRVYTNTDIHGVELCGALKNIIALAGGISDGVGYGDNAKAAIITRGLYEITKLGLAMGSEVKTFAGLTGIGDIVVTATSKHSRNNKAGYLIGKGYSVEDAKKEVGMVVEGINALQGAIALKNKYNVELPIIEAVYQVIFENKDVKESVISLFNRSQKSELN